MHINCCRNNTYYIQYNTIQYNTIQYNTIQYNTIQYNTIQYILEHHKISKPKFSYYIYYTFNYNTVLLFFT